ncbi:universal stress protein [Streptomyces sp. WMMB 322]|uniref:universal stress protein n=1 Tax=Streptomyces sp. WMMB 322 TaxID=1286821 RepID=UPI0006E347F5|nr:universal stress protein [Streptomyces sp. WMMB 322]SCK08696.1 Nucleotide-binding universal stress protein, UspA family [Streptomyces sp. WMMB 322]
MTGTVVVGLDGSAQSRAAARWAASEAVSREAVLDLVHVVASGPSAGPAVPAGELGSVPGQGEMITREADEELAERHPRLRMTRRVLTGRPDRLLCELTSGSDLVVLGSRNLDPVAGFLIGSVALRVVAHARCPVVLVRSARREPSAPPGVPASGHVLLGVDLPGPADELVSFAFGEAARRGCGLRIVHGWQMPLTMLAVRQTAEPSRLPAELGEERAEALHLALRPWREKYPGVRVDECALQGRPARHLLKEAQDASVVVVGRRVHRAPASTPIGAVTHAVLHHATVPVAVVPH